MKKIQNLTMKVKNRVLLSLAGVTPEKEQGEPLVEILGLALVAIAVLIIFKQQLTNLFTTFMANLTTEFNKLFATV